MTKEALQLMGELDLLYEERAALHHDLRRSLVLQELVPDVFAHGRAKTRVQGNPRNELTFVVTLGNGEQRTMPLEEVPVILWSESVKADIRDLGPYHARKYHRLMTKGEDDG